MHLFIRGLKTRKSRKTKLFFQYPSDLQCTIGRLPLPLQHVFCIMYFALYSMYFAAQCPVMSDSCISTQLRTLIAVHSFHLQNITPHSILIKKYRWGTTTSNKNIKCRKSTYHLDYKKKKYKLKDCTCFAMDDHWLCWLWQSILFFVQMPFFTTFPEIVPLPLYLIFLPKWINTMAG